MVLELTVTRLTFSFKAGGQGLSYQYFLLSKAIARQLIAEMTIKFHELQRSFLIKGGFRL